MADSKKAVLPRMIQACSRLLALVGAAVFFVGDKFLHEVKHLSFFVSEVDGILGGVFLMLVGWGIASVGKSKGEYGDSDPPGSE